MSADGQVSRHGLARRPFQQASDALSWRVRIVAWINAQQLLHKRLALVKGDAIRERATAINKHLHFSCGVDEEDFVKLLLLMIYRLYTHARYSSSLLYLAICSQAVFWLGSADLSFRYLRRKNSIEYIFPYK